MPNYSKKQYLEIGEILSNQDVWGNRYSKNPVEYYENLVKAFCTLFQEDNPVFDERKFRKLCGLKETN
jgi:hypothetical protein